MKKSLVTIAVFLALLMVMGFASREWRTNGAQHGEVHVYEVHLKYYEEIRPSLAAGSGAVSALCNGESAEMASSLE